MIIMTIAIWFAQKDTSNKFPDCNLFTYLQLGCWSIHYLAPHRGRARYCNAHVCLSVCVFVCPCFRKISKCNISAISQPITMKFGTYTGGAAGEVCHLWLPCCIWYSQFSNRGRNHGYTCTSVYYTSYHNQDFTMSHYDIKDRQQITANEWPIVGKIYTGCMQQKYCTSHSFLSCRYCVANNFVNTSNECCDWPRYIGVFIGVNRLTQVILLMINPS